VVSGGVVGMDFTQSLDSKTVSALHVLVSERSVVRTFNCNREVASWTFRCHVTRMWANAQRDGLPVEHRWRPLFNAAKFG